jgi:hypothetical protein
VLCETKYGELHIEKLAWLSMTRLAWLRTAGRQFFYLTNIIFLEKLAREILEKIMKRYRPKIIMLTILSCPKLPRTSFEN